LLLATSPAGAHQSTLLPEPVIAAIRLLQYRGLRGSGGEYFYEVLNLVDGRRTATEIGDSVSAIYGPVPLEMIVEYLRALESIKIIDAVR